MLLLLKLTWELGPSFVILFSPLVPIKHVFYMALLSG